MAKKKGPLETKVKHRALPIFADKEQQLAVIGEWMDEDHKKLFLLCDELGVKDGPARFYDLALALARKHCLGFQEQTPLSKWTDKTRALLVVEINRLIADKRTHAVHTVSSAADVLATRSEWEEFLGGNGEDRGEALRVQYQKFYKKPWATTFWEAFQWHVHEGTVPEWEAELRDALRDPHGLKNM